MSSQMAEFNRSCKTSYQSAIVSIALSCAVYDLTSKNIVTLKSRLQESLKVIGNVDIR